MALPERRSWRRAGAWAAAIAVLALVFAAYRDPHLMVELANQIRSCF